jgi:hypothetical protein
MNIKRIAAVTAVAATLTFTLAGCSTGTTTGNPGENPEVTSPTEVPPTDILVGDDPGTWTPVILTVADNGATVTVIPGQNIILTLPGDDASNEYVIESDNPEVASPTQREENADYTTNPSVKALTPGEATVVVWDRTAATTGNALEPVMTFTVDVEEAA